MRTGRVKRWSLFALHTLQILAAAPSGKAFAQAFRRQ
jgi:hypothetical protein